HKQVAYGAILVRAKVGAAFILVGDEHQHEVDEANLSLRERASECWRDLTGEPLHGKAENLVSFRIHAAAPNLSASTLLWKARQNQPEKALIGSTFRPSAYSRAAEIQIAEPLRLAKISHQWSAALSAFSPLALSQVSIASSRSSMPPGRLISPLAHKGSI